MIKVILVGKINLKWAWIMTFLLIKAIKYISVLFCLVFLNALINPNDLNRFSKTILNLTYFALSFKF